MDAGQFAAVLCAPVHQGHFTLQGHGIGHQSPTRAQVLPAGVEHAVAGHAAADENRIRRFQPCQGLGRAAANQLQARHAEGLAVVFDQLLAAGVGFNCQGAAAGVGAHPFDADGAAARADVPKQFAGGGGKAREGHGSHIALGQLAVMLEGRIRQAGQARQARGIGVGEAVDGDQVQRGNRRVLPAFGVAIDAPFSAATEVFKHTQAARAKTAAAQHGGDSGRALAVVAQHQQAHTAGQMGIERGHRAGDYRQCQHILQRPAQACCRQ